MKRAKEFGLPEVTLKPADYSEIKKRIQSVISFIQKHDSEERFCRLGVKVEFGQANFVDEHTIRHDEKKYSAKTSGHVSCRKNEIRLETEKAIMKILNIL